MFQHGTIIQTGIICNKTLFICGTPPACRALLKMQKYFEVKLNIFEISHW